jgi:uncharacterized FlaG/YvyC family protein
MIAELVERMGLLLKAHSFDATIGSAVAEAYTKFGFRSEGMDMILKELSQSYLKLASTNKWRPHSVTSMIYALSRQCAADESVWPLYHQLASYIIDKQHRYSITQLSIIASSYARQRYAHKGLFKLISRRAIIEDHVPHRDMSSIAWSLSHVGIFPRSFFDIVVPMVMLRPLKSWYRVELNQWMHTAINLQAYARRINNATTSSTNSSSISDVTSSSATTATGGAKPITEFTAEFIEKLSKTLQSRNKSLSSRTDGAATTMNDAIVAVGEEVVIDLMGVLSSHGIRDYTTTSPYPRTVYTPDADYHVIDATPIMSSRIKDTETPLIDEESHAAVHAALDEVTREAGQARRHRKLRNKAIEKEEAKVMKHYGMSKKAIQQRRRRIDDADDEDDDNTFLTNVDLSETSNNMDDATADIDRNAPVAKSSEQTLANGTTIIRHGFND